MWDSDVHMLCNDDYMGECTVPLGPLMSSRTFEVCESVRVCVCMCVCIHTYIHMYICVCIYKERTV